MVSDVPANIYAFGIIPSSELVRSKKEMIIVCSVMERAQNDDHLDMSQFYQHQ